jgi:prepilin-type N-terminal cleavage/methylation domain-containing protein
MPRLFHAATTNQKGYTLVELSVAAMVLGIAVIAAIAMIRKSRDFEIDGNIVRQARNIAASTLEDSVIFQTSRYPVEVKTHVIAGEKSIYILPGKWITPTVNVVATEIQTETWGTMAIPYQEIKAVVRWTYNGKSDSVISRKRIAQIK